MPDYARACRPPDYAPNYAIMPSIMARALGWGAGAEGGWEGTQPVSAANRAQQAARSLEPPQSAAIQPFCDLQPR